MDFKKDNRDLEVGKTLEDSKKMKEALDKLKTHQEAMREEVNYDRVIGYIKSRGFTEAQAEEYVSRYKIGYDKEYDSLSFPTNKGYIYRGISGSSKGYNGVVDIAGKEAFKKNVVFICEGVFDMLSLEALNLNAISINSVSNINALQDFISSNERYKDKQYIIAIDNDVAGSKARELLSSYFIDNNIRYSILELPIGSKEDKQDINTLYQANREFLNDSIRKVVTDIFPSMLQKQKNMMELSSSNKGKTKFKTGYKLLDGMLVGGLQEGELTILGAESSIGKTTFMLNVMDNVANEKPVLYFTIEQSQHELYCKLLSKEYYNLFYMRKDIIDKKYGSMRDFQNLTHINNFEYEQVQEQRASRDNNIFFIEGNFSMTVDTIKEEVENFISLFGKVPLVIIDYLQIIKPPAESRLTEKQVLDYNITTLRQVSRNTKAHIVCISSLNRASYSKKAGLEALKESGGLEYTADNVMLIFPIEVIEGEEAGSENYKSKATKEAGLKLLKHRAGLIKKEPLLFKFRGNYSHFEEDSFFTETDKVQKVKTPKKVEEMFSKR